jgi:hypothetical protein
VKKQLEVWRQYLVEVSEEKIDYKALEERARERVRQQLPNFNQVKRKRLADLLYKYLQDNDIYLGSKEQFNNLAHHLGYDQYNWIKQTKVDFVDNVPDAYGIYTTPNNIKISKTDDEGKKIPPGEMFNTLVHELLHAVDHTNYNFNTLKKDPTISKDKKKDIIKLIQSEVEPRWIAHRLRGHKGEGLMAMLNRHLFDDLMSTRTRQVSGGDVLPKKPETEADYEVYHSREDERYVRFKNLIDAIKQVNHPASEFVTKEDIKDFCKNGDKYFKIHDDIKPLHKGLIICKQIRNKEAGDVQIEKAQMTLNRIVKAKDRSRSKIAEDK